MTGGWPTSEQLPRNWVPHISILRCGQSRNARTAFLSHHNMPVGLEPSTT
jgi:hypothetical protein